MPLGSLQPLNYAFSKVLKVFKVLKVPKDLKDPKDPISNF